MTKRQGGCQCGRVRYAFDDAAALTLYCCHCLECQRQSTSAFGMSLLLPEDALELTGDALATWERGTDRGTRNRAHFCRSCGVRIFHRPSGRGGIVALKAGTLDDASELDPVGHIWFSRAQPWVQTRQNDLIYPGQPDDYDALIVAFRDRRAAD